MWDIKRIWRRKIEENRREKVLFSNTDLRKLIKSIYISAFAMNILVVLRCPFCDQYLRIVRRSQQLCTSDPVYTILPVW